MRHTNTDPLAKLIGLATEAELHSLYLSIAKRTHPDHGGSTAEMQALNALWDEVRGDDGRTPTHLTDIPADVRWGLQDYRDECKTVASKWNARLAKADIQALVVPASPGLFTVTVYDIDDMAVGHLLHDHLMENEPF